MCIIKTHNKHINQVAINYYINANPNSDGNRAAPEPTVVLHRKKGGKTLCSYSTPLIYFIQPDTFSTQVCDVY